MLLLTVTTLILFGLFIPMRTSIFTQSTWYVDDDTTVSYTIEKAEMTARMGDLQVESEGVVFENVKVKPSNSFDVEVISIDNEYGIEYEVDNSTTSASGEIATDLFLFQFTQFAYYPEQETLRLSIQGFNSQEYIHGPNMINWFFVEPEESLWDYFEEIADIEYHKSRENNHDYEAYFEGFFEIRDEQAIVDLYMYGSFTNETTEIDMNFNHNIKFVWSSVTGILLGYRISTTLSGTVKELIVSESISIVCSKNDYSLPGYKFYNYSGFISGFEIAVAIISLTIVTFIGFNIKKRKK